MDVIHYINKSLSRPISSVRKRVLDYNQYMNSRARIKGYLRYYNIPKLSDKEDAEVRDYFKSRGYKLKHTDWHAYYKARSGKLYNSYIPRGFYKTHLSSVLNQKTQWPALLDKNLYYRIFEEFEQPYPIVQNINGFYYINNKQVDQDKAVKRIKSNDRLLVIKPSLETGRGKMVLAFSVVGDLTSYRKHTIEGLLSFYKKDFVVQEFVKQSSFLSALNPKSLNTFRVVSYLNQSGSHVLSVNIKVGGSGSYTDNYSTGGLMCGVDENGKLKSRGFTKKGEILDKTLTGIMLEGYDIPNYESIIQMVKLMHLKVPYFKLISWDIAMNEHNRPVLIEYNTYNQGFEQQMCNGPIFGKFTDEIFEMGLKS